MAVMRETNLYGFSVQQGQYRPTNDPPRFLFRDQDTGRHFAIDEPTVFKNLLLLGGAGSGKTNVLNQIVAQALHWNRSGQRDGVSLIFDTKGDYITHPGFYQDGDYILGNDRRYRKRSVIWNLFDEVLADGNAPMDYEGNARETSVPFCSARPPLSSPSTFASIRICTG